MLQLYQNIKRLREERGMSQDELARKTGYTNRSSITKIECGLVDLAQSKIELFASALGVSAPDLMGWGMENPPEPKPEGKALEFIQLWSQLNTDEQKLVLSQIKGILSNRE